MKPTILVAGGTGNLGGRIITALIKRGAEVKKTEFKLILMGSMEDFSASNKQERSANPEGERELYPSWQGKQYLHSMFSVQNIPLDNERYSDIQWTSAIDVISKI
jgi:hypothetical protein